MDGLSTSRPGRFTTGNYQVLFAQQQGWDLRDGPDGCGKPRPQWDSIPEPSSQ
jgi:hypothetical protein